MSDGLKYQAHVDLSRKNNSHTQLVVLTGRDKKVLEVGPATGYITRALSERGCRVSCIESDPDAAAVASSFCERMIVGNIEEVDLSATFEEDRFDVVMFGDVLEHLLDPETVLRKVHLLLNPGGYVLASIPNIAHASIVLNLIAGEFQYTDLGLLDKTHLRLFTRSSVEKLFRETGYRITLWRRILLDPFETEVAVNKESYPAHILDAIRQGPESSTYQFIVKAYPVNRRSNHSLNGRQHFSSDQRNSPVVGALWQTQEIISRLGEAEAALTERESTITAVRRQLREEEQETARLAGVVANHEATIGALSGELSTIQGSIGYQLLLRGRRLIRPPIRWVAPAASRRRRALLAARHGLKTALSRGGRRALRKAVRFWEWPDVARNFSRGSLSSLDVDARYEIWLRDNAITEAKARGIKKAAAGLNYRPRISIVVPVYNPEPSWLRDAIDSVRGQLYDNWQLCIADDASTKPGVRELLIEYEQDARINVVYQGKNQGISAASNAALALADGEYIGLLDHDDELTPDALHEVVKLLNERQYDFIYSDEDKRDPSGRRVAPFFKPDWSPDLEYSSNYVTHFSVYRRKLVQEVGGFRKEFDGSQDYDLALRVTERTHDVGHVRKVLYTWRMVPGSAAASSEAKPYAYEAAKKALTESLERRGVDGWVEEGKTMGWYRIRYRVPAQALVSTIIPTRDRADLLARCLAKLRKSSYKQIEIIVVDNGSVEEATRALLRSQDLTVVRDDGDFNFSRLINIGANSAKGDYLLLLNNDIEAINEDWIEAMLEHAQRPEVGVVGARLLYPSGRPQHEGVALGIGGTFAGHVDWRNYLGLSHAVRNCSAVTAAAAMTRRSVFNELRGFDESFRVAYGDVDYCLRARQRGYLVVYTPYALLYHHESASRGDNHPPEDEIRARKRWGHLTDPYYSDALDEILEPWVYGPDYAATESRRG